MHRRSRSCAAGPGTPETIYALYVTDASRHLTGILSLRDLVVADPEQRVGDVMTREVVSVGTDTDQEEVARVIQRYDFLAVPVVDREERLVGIVTVDDVIDVIQQEATRDLYAAGAVQAGDEDDYFQSNLFSVARRRVVWLLVLLIANSGTAAVIASMDGVLKQVVVLAAFIPPFDWHRGQCRCPELHGGHPRPEHPAHPKPGPCLGYWPRSYCWGPAGPVDGAGGGALDGLCERRQLARGLGGWDQPGGDHHLGGDRWSGVAAVVQQPGPGSRSHVGAVYRHSHRRGGGLHLPADRQLVADSGLWLRDLAS